MVNLLTLRDSCHVSITLFLDRHNPVGSQLILEARCRRDGQVWESQQTFHERYLQGAWGMLEIGVSHVLQEVFDKAIVEIMQEKFKDEYTGLSEKGMVP